MTSYALPTTVSPSRHDFERRSFFLPNAQTHSSLEEQSLQAFAQPPFGARHPSHRTNFRSTGPITSHSSISPDDAMPQNAPGGGPDLGEPEPHHPTFSTAYSSSRLSNASDNDPGTASEKSSTKSLTAELVTAILIPLPFLLSSLVIPSLAVDDAGSTQTEPVTSDGKSRKSNIVFACAVTSGALLLVGIIGRILGYVSRRNQSKNPSAQDGISFSLDVTQSPAKTLRHLCITIMSVLSPFLASVEIGGARTGAFLLAGVAGGMVPTDAQNGAPSLRQWRRVTDRHWWSLLTLGLSLTLDLFAASNDVERLSTLHGYAWLIYSILFVQLPTSKAAASTQKFSSPLVRSQAETSYTLSAGAILGTITYGMSKWLTGVPSLTPSSMALSVASIAAAAYLLIRSRPSSLRSQAKLGFIAGLLCCVAFHAYKSNASAGQTITICAVLSLTFVATQLDARVLATGKNSAHSASNLRRDSFQRLEQASNLSAFSRVLLSYTEGFPLLHSILKEKESRRIVYFMCVNLGFMFIQTFYAVAAGSLGLLSDSIHMLFDCVGLLAGLIASVMSKWPPNAQFPYGYGKVETLSGLGNGIFLMIISVEIIWESFERFVEGAELRRLTELLVVSVGGLAVNCIGLIFIGHHHHGHSHSHSHSHGHTHGASHASADIGHDGMHVDGCGHEHVHETAVLPLKRTPSSVETESHTRQHQHHDHHHRHHNHDSQHHHSHKHAGHHDHANENMAGIYLHILADTMGSVAVIASTILTKYTGWSGWDPLASCAIALLIIAASYPLVVGSARQLLLTVPSEVEYSLRNTLQELSSLRGVSAYAVPRFWLDDGGCQPAAHANHSKGAQRDEHEHGEGHQRHSHSHDHHSEKKTCSNDDIGGQKLLGVIHIIAAQNADTDEVRVRVTEFLESKNIDAIVHVEREEQSRCWCGGAGQGKAHARNRSTVAM